MSKSSRDLLSAERSTTSNATACSPQTTLYTPGHNLIPAGGQTAPGCTYLHSWLVLLPVILRNCLKSPVSLNIIAICQLRIFPPEHGTQPTHITIRYARVTFLDIFSSLIRGGFCNLRRIHHTHTSFLCLSMQIPGIILHVDLGDFLFAIDIVLIHIPWRATAKPTR